MFIFSSNQDDDDECHAAELTEQSLEEENPLLDDLLEDEKPLLDPLLEDQKPKVNDKLEKRKTSEHI